MTVRILSCCFLLNVFACWALRALAEYLMKGLSSWGRRAGSGSTLFPNRWSLLKHLGIMDLDCAQGWGREGAAFFNVVHKSETAAGDHCTEQRHQGETWRRSSFKLRFIQFRRFPYVFLAIFVAFIPLQSVFLTAHLFVVYINYTFSCCLFVCPWLQITCRISAVVTKSLWSPEIKAAYDGSSHWCNHFAY